MYDTVEEYPTQAQDAVVAPAPPLLLAGVDEDDTWEPHVVRGID
ncbi:surface protein [Streptomyces aquilus]